jgi:hypothetical protein
MSNRGKGVVEGNRKNTPKANWAECWDSIRRNQATMKESRKALRVRERRFRYQQRLRSHDRLLGPDEENELTLLEEEKIANVASERVKQEDASIKHGSE